MRDRKWSDTLAFVNIKLSIKMKTRMRKLMVVILVVQIYLPINSRSEDGDEMVKAIRGLIQIYGNDLEGYRCEYVVTNLVLGHKWRYAYETDGHRVLAHRIMFEGEKRDILPGGNSRISSKFSQKIRPEDYFAYDGETYQYCDVNNDRLYVASDIEKLADQVNSYWQTNPLFNPWLSLLNYPELSNISFDSKDGFGMLKAYDPSGGVELAFAGDEISVLVNGRRVGSSRLIHLGSKTLPNNFELAYSKAPGGLRWELIETREIGEGEGARIVPWKIKCIYDTGKPGVSSASSYAIDVETFEVVSDKRGESHFTLPPTIAAERVDLDFQIQK